ncbi:MAG: rod shape-determining protein [Lachnospiraceae bacterium]|nr:rod shape-determining protein [Lachnospiraceae bacterium]
METVTVCPEHFIFGLDIGTRSIVGTVGYREGEENFHVLGQVIKMHESRAMLDGQIHDIRQVANTIKAVKNELQKMLGYKLEKVCIAAAGRVLHTVQVRAEYQLEMEKVVDDEDLHSLELVGMEQAYAHLKANTQLETSMYCVGSTVVHYYLDDFLMLNLKDHKGKKIAADILATFLPNEVIDSLYEAVKQAGLSVANLTLEPIAASELAIPKNYRLLNIALVDVGAGTSDISITKDGSIIGYGMLPVAGDAFTEVLAQKYLVDFQTAEKIKLDSTKKKKVSFKDIMGITQKVDSKEVLDTLEQKIDQATQQLADKIKELNGGNSVSAVFIVGGGGKMPLFPKKLAQHLELQEERVAVRGDEVFHNISFAQEKVKLDSTLVTPIGICMQYLANADTFVLVSLNEKQVKLFDNKHLSVMDASVQVGYPKENLFPKRGKEIRFFVNREVRVLPGGIGEGAKIFVNGNEANLHTRIEANDIIVIEPSTEGEAAKGTIGELPEYKRKGEISITFNDKPITLPRVTKLNDAVALENQEIQEGDHIEILEYYRLEEIIDLMDLSMPTYFLINGKEARWEDHIYSGNDVDCVWEQAKQESTQASEYVPEMVVESKAEEENMVLSDGVEQDLTSAVNDIENTVEDENNEKPENLQTQEDALKIDEQEATPVLEDGGIHNLQVTVNGENVVLTGKANYTFVNVLDVYPFDTSVVGGSVVVTKINGEDSNFSAPIQNGDAIELYWKE